MLSGTPRLRVGRRVTCAGRKVLVIGGGSGIGLASAEALLRAGASVFLSGRRAGTLREAADSLTQFGRVEWHAGDASLASDVARVVDRAVLALDGLDTLVVSAGATDIASVFDIQPERFDAVMAGNLNPVYLGSHFTTPHLVRSGRGSIVAIASVYGVVGQRERIAYSTAKAGIIGMVRSMALDLAPHNVRVNAISPGVIETDLFFDTLRREADPVGMLQKRRAMHPIGRTGKPEEVASVVVLLASDAGGFITGQNIIVDGGFTIA